MSKSKTHKESLGLVPLMPQFKLIKKVILLITGRAKKDYIVIRQSLNSKEEFLELLVYIKETILWFLR